ncbi:MAG TPA: zf-HC2 domain-containing protein, partial [Thermoanaerobaculia bacterium]|nr:zf-HC2 domain-containing protein [Thermoanaerobaculia bacterium]
MSLSESLRSAWDGCPSHEDWLRLETGEATPDERRRLEEHAARCPACASEREMARLFSQAPGDEDVDDIVSKLEALNLPEQPVPLAFPSRRPALVWAARLAAVLVLALGAVLFFRAGQAPPLPDPGPGEVYRGGQVRPIA